MITGAARKSRRELLCRADPHNRRLARRELKEQAK